MHLISSGLSEDTFAGKGTYLDNDFLSLLFSDSDVFTDIESLTKRGSVYVDPRTRFEFLREVFLLEQRSLKERFLDNNLFQKNEDHPTTDVVGLTMRAAGPAAGAAHAG